MTDDPTSFWMQLERLERLIRASELKAGLIFSFHSLMLGLFVDRFNYIHDILGSSWYLILLVGGWVSFVVISIYFAIKCFIPRIESKFDKNVFFFKDAVNNFGTIKEYSKTLINTCMDEKILFDQLSQQIFIESKIIDEKFKSVHKSIKYLAISFVFVVLMLVLLLFKL
jgi:hypothetical protein